MMGLPLNQALSEAQAARTNVEEWVRAVNRRKVEYALLQRHPREETRYLYELVGDCLAFLGRHGECDEAMRFVMSVMAYEEALANIECAIVEPRLTDLEQMHDEAEDDTPAYLR